MGLDSCVKKYLREHAGKAFNYHKDLKSVYAQKYDALIIDMNVELFRCSQFSVMFRLHGRFSDVPFNFYSMQQKTRVCPNGHGLGQVRLQLKNQAPRRQGRGPAL